MAVLIVRRTGNSLGLHFPREMVKELGISAGDQVRVQIQPVPRLLSLAGRLKGKLTADEFTALSNEGEDLG